MSNMDRSSKPIQRVIEIGYVLQVILFLINALLVIALKDDVRGIERIGNGLFIFQNLIIIVKRGRDAYHEFLYRVPHFQLLMNSMLIITILIFA